MGSIRGSTVLLVIGFFFAVLSLSNGQYEDIRCKCICPSPEVVNGTASLRKLYIGNVEPGKCDCDGVVLPQADEEVRNKAKEFCPRCECKYESRNTTTIRVVVILIICVVSLLVVYMLFLMCLDPLLNKRPGCSAAYTEHTNEEVNLQDEPLPTSRPIRSNSEGGSNMFNRVGLQQDRWKRQVQEQRRNIYDRHTMLNWIHRDYKLFEDYEV